MTQVRVGHNNTLTAYFRLQNPGPLVDATGVTVAIKNPANSIIQAAAAATRTALGTYQFTWSTPANTPIGEGYKAVWEFTYASGTSSAEQLLNVIAAGDMTFEPPKNNVLVSDSTAILPEIDTRWLNQIRKVLAYPEVDEILLTPAQIKEFCVIPALLRYFTKFPIKKKDQIAVQQAGTINFPDYSEQKQEVIGVTDLRFVNKDYPYGNSDLWAIVRYQQQGAAMRGVGGYGTRYDFGGNSASLIAQQQKYDSLQNLNSYNADIRWDERKIYYYSSVASALHIEWALSSLNFDHVRPQWRLDVIQLAQAELLWHLGRTTGIIEDTNLDQKVLSSELNAQAKELFDAVMEKWGEIPDPIMVRQ